MHVLHANSQFTQVVDLGTHFTQIDNLRTSYYTS